MELLKFREQCRRFYSGNSTWIDFLIRFFAVLLSLLVLNAKMGLAPYLGNLPVILGLAALGALLPGGLRLGLLAVCFLADLYFISPESMGVGALLLLLMFVTYYIFQPEQEDILYLVPLFFALRIPYVIPIAVGLLGAITGAVPVVFGVILYYYMEWSTENISILSAGSSLTTFQKLDEITSSLIGNQEMILYAAAFAVTVCVVFLLRRSSQKYTGAIAVFGGILTELMILMLGMYSLNLKFSLPVFLLGLACAALIDSILAFFLFNVDYSRTVMTQFEDDEYYYYVKAVPKYSLTSEQRQVTHYEKTGEDRWNEQPGRSSRSSGAGASAARPGRLKSRSLSSAKKTGRSHDFTEDDLLQTDDSQIYALRRRSLGRRRVGIVSQEKLAEAEKRNREASEAAARALLEESPNFAAQVEQSLEEERTAKARTDEARRRYRSSIGRLKTGNVRSAERGISGRSGGSDE